MAGAGYKVFQAGAVLPASDVNTYLMDQTLMTFAGTAARGSAIGTAASEGMHTYRTDGDVIDIYNGTTWIPAVPIGSWTSYQPTWTNLSVGNGTNQGFYIRHGKTIHLRIYLSFGSTTSVTGIFYPNTPTGLDKLSGSDPVGVGWAFDASATVWNQFHFSVESYLIRDGDGNQARYNATQPWTWAVNDSLRLSVTYEVA